MTEPQPTPPVSASVPAPKRRRPLLTFLRRRLEGWRLRHRLAVNFALHMIGIPLAVSGVVLLFFLPWYWGVGAFVLGYLLQYIGHCFEGNDLGEWAAIKRLLGLPYVGISPRWNPEDPSRL
jgi:2-hydroxy-palmitic acid dioxygenase Mpo1-like